MCNEVERIVFILSIFCKWFCSTESAVLDKDNVCLTQVLMPILLYKLLLALLGKSGLVKKINKKKIK